MLSNSRSKSEQKHILHINLTKSLALKLVAGVGTEMLHKAGIAANLGSEIGRPQSDQSLYAAFVAVMPTMFRDRSHIGAII